MAAMAGRDGEKVLLAVDSSGWRPWPDKMTNDEKVLLAMDGDGGHGRMRWREGIIGYGQRGMAAVDTR